MPERPNMWHIFEKRIVQGYQKWHLHVSNMQIQKYKYTNTQIQHMTKCQKDPTCAIFLKRGLFKDIKNDISLCQTIQNTNTKYTNSAYNEVPETPNIWHIFEKRIIQGYHKWYSHMSNRQIQKCKYTNTQIQSIQQNDRKKHVAYFWNSCTIVQIW